MAECGHMNLVRLPDRRVLVCRYCDLVLTEKQMAEVGARVIIDPLPTELLRAIKAADETA